MRRGQRSLRIEDTPDGPLILEVKQRGPEWRGRPDEFGGRRVRLARDRTGQEFGRDLADAFPLARAAASELAKDRLIEIDCGARHDACCSRCGTGCPASDRLRNRQRGERGWRRSVCQRTGSSSCTPRGQSSSVRRRRSSKLRPFGANTVRARTIRIVTTTRAKITSSMVTTKLSFAGNKSTRDGVPGQQVNSISVVTPTSFRGQRIVGGNVALDLLNTQNGAAGAEPEDDVLTDYRDFLAWASHIGVITAAEERRFRRRA